MYRLGLLALALGAFLGLGQEVSGPTVQLGTSDLWGAHLTDAEGNSLYLYREDAQGSGESVCLERCTSNWLPLTVEGEPVAGEGVSPDLVGTIERPDGSRQVTYDGWPLYRYVRDFEPGDTRGQALGDVFYLVDAAGASVTEALAEEVPDVDEEAFAQLMNVGEAGYVSDCAVCHGAEGQGGIGPRLTDNSNLARTTFVVGRILHGFVEHGMPPFAHLPDEEIAGISTYIRNAWSNEYGPVTPEIVSAQR